MSTTIHRPPDSDFEYRRLSEISKEETERVLETSLRKNGFEIERWKERHERETHLMAFTTRRLILIDVIPCRRSQQERTLDFCEGACRCVSRMYRGATGYVLAMPEQFSTAMVGDDQFHEIAWRNLQWGIPELSLWLVDCTAGSYRERRFKPQFTLMSRTERASERPPGSGSAKPVRR